MELPVKKQQVTSLLDNDVLARLERLRLNPLRRQTSRSHGEHLAGKGGTSTEFSDYRNYVSGDDIRFVDWNIFARLQRPYLKQYRHEEELNVVLILDSSSSMKFEDKLLRGKQLAAAFGLFGLLNVERVSAYACSDESQGPTQFPPCTGRMNMSRLFAFLENVEGGGYFPIDEAVDAVLKRHRGRGVAVVLSDFLTFGDLGRPMNRLYSAGLETFAVQILGPTEADPDVTGDLRFVDSETGDTLDISSAGDLLGLYHEHREALQSELQTICRRRSGRFLSIRSRDPLEWVLFDLLRRRGWVR